MIMAVYKEDNWESRSYDQRDKKKRRTSRKSNYKKKQKTFKREKKQKQLIEYAMNKERV